MATCKSMPRFDFGCEAIFSHREGFLLCYRPLGDEVRTPYPYRRPGHLYYIPLTVRILGGTTTTLPRPYQRLLIVSSYHAAIRAEQTAISQQSRRPPRGQQPCRNPWAAERAAYTVMGYCMALSMAPDVFMHLGLSACSARFLLAGGWCPAPRYARYH